MPFLRHNKVCYGVQICLGNIDLILDGVQRILSVDDLGIDVSRLSASLLLADNDVLNKIAHFLLLRNPHSCRLGRNYLSLESVNVSLDHLEATLHFLQDSDCILRVTHHLMSVELGYHLFNFCTNSLLLESYLMDGQSLLVVLR